MDESGTENSSKEEIAREREIEGKLKEKAWKRGCKCEKVKLGFCWECTVDGRGLRSGIKPTEQRANERLYFIMIIFSHCC